MCFKCSTDVHMYKELKSLKNWIGQNEAKITAATLNFDEFCKNHVQDELNFFYLAENAKQEALK